MVDTEDDILRQELNAGDVHSGSEYKKFTTIKSSDEDIDMDYHFSIKLIVYMFLL